MSHGIKFHIVICTLVGLSWPASETYASSFLTPGAEVKRAAGAGVTQSRGAPSLYYNPANLSRSEQFEPYGEVALLNLDYKFEYPGHDTVGIQATLPVPFIGWSHKLWDKFTYSATILPIPEGAGKMAIDNLPIREISDTPLLVNMETGGKGLSIDAAFGMAYEAIPGLSVGISILHSQPGNSTKATDPEMGWTLLELESRGETTSTIIGGRFFGLNRTLLLGIAYKPVSTTIQRGRYRAAGITGEFVDYEHSFKNASTASLGLELSLPYIRPFIDITREFHEPVRHDRPTMLGEREDMDFYNVDNYAVGATLEPVKGHEITGAYGIYPSHIGDGIMASRADNEEELRGMAFQEFDGVGRTVYAGGYKYQDGDTHYDVGASYQTGVREVAESARGYGTYTLNIMYLTFGMRADLGSE